ncbi:MAG: hypothetical protein Q7T73_14885 [Beijerinckiaceae bacterium]|nr:hypothetical protein [Beijerinckiaceae bacterium]
MKSRSKVLEENAAGAPATVISGEDFLVYLGEDAGIFLLRQQFAMSADQLQARINNVTVALEIELLDVPPPLPPVAPVLPGFRVSSWRAALASS